jgi:hypothetical protein
MRKTVSPEGNIKIISGLLLNVVVHDSLFIVLLYIANNNLHYIG